VQVVRVLVLLKKGLQEVSLSPLVAKDNRQLLHVLNCCLSDGENIVFHPFKTNGAQLLIEEGFTQLPSKDG
jgi:hypothetical protein